MMRNLLIAANVLIPFAVLIFATGFFPYKPFITGLASHDDFAGHGVAGKAPAARFDKIVFMVVDALRSDFVFAHGSGFEFTQKLIRSGEAIPFTAHASSPTITMPKVKAITTGSVPSFLDVILNFAESDTTSTLATQDTWLAQIRAGRNRKNDGRLIMYGDDTWLKLFPHTFTRSDGTTSFFVSDFTEVDRNVTRHIPQELENSDWDAMILHYLGLDHIGHKAGPLSPNMLPKQKEMDLMVQVIYEATTKYPHLDNTLLVLCGDHGMTDGGNHGGSSPGETSPALVFISPHFRNRSDSRNSPSAPSGAYSFYDKVDQSDLAPTISSLLGYPIPKNNVGVIIPQLLELWQEGKDRIDLLMRNSLQILSIVKATFPAQDFDSVGDLDCEEFSSDAQALACKWQVAKSVGELQFSEADNQVRIKALYSFLEHAKDVMSTTASNYDLDRLIAGAVLVGLAVGLTCVACVTCRSFHYKDTPVFASIVALYGIMMFASSYVEEEQQFWYWIAGGWIAYLRFITLHQHATISKGAISFVQSGTLALLTIHRVLQRWNQTGQKHAGSSDITNTLLSSHPSGIWSMVAFTYSISSLQVAYSVAKYLKFGYAAGILSSLLLTVPSIALKLAFIASDAPELLSFIPNEKVELVRQLPVMQIARLFFSVLIVLLTTTMFVSSSGSRERYNRKAILHTYFSCFILLLITQSRTHNIPLFACFIMQHKFLQRLRLSPIQISINTLIMAHVSFFALGNSNAISSVDLSNGYNGVSGYNVVAVGALVFISNWAGPIFWSISGIVLLSNAQEPQSLSAESATTGNEQQPAHRFLVHLTINTLFISASTLAMMVACTILRTHLFIWTVFSPKYLYTMAWSLAYHYFVTVILGGSLWRLTQHLN